MKFRTLVTLSACSMCLSQLNSAHAQQAAPKSQQTAPVVQVELGDKPAHHAHGQLNDHVLAASLAIENQEEVAIAKFAQGRAHSPKVKEFASMIEKDHRAFLQKLEKLAPEAARDGFLTDPNSQVQVSANEGNAKTRPGVNIEAAGGAVKVSTKEGAIQQAGATADVAENRHGHHTGILEVHREIAQACLNESIQGLSTKEGTKFDECFIGQQIVMHGRMKATLSVFQRHATGELREIISEGIQTTEKHKKNAEEIMIQLASTESKASSTSKK